jgi:hypothetical protein
MMLTLPRHVNLGFELEMQVLRSSCQLEVGSGIILEPALIR